MSLLYALLVTRKLPLHGRRINTRRMAHTIRKESKFYVELIKDIMHLINKIFRFILGVMKSIIKKICPSKTVENSIADDDSNVINLTEYKSKQVKDKAKSS